MASNLEQSLEGICEDCLDGDSQEYGYCTNTGVCYSWLCTQCDKITQAEDYHQNTLTCNECRYGDE